MANPVLLKEFRTRMRSKKSRTTQLAIGIPTVLVIVVVYVRLLFALLEVKHDNGDIWLICSMLQLVIICFLAPALLANAITQEKEQRTWGLLLVTRLTSWQIVTGKLIARLVPIPLIMALFAPFMAYSAVVSHIKWPMIVGTYAILLASLLLFGVQALFWSWLLKRTSTATAASYGLVFLLTAGTAIAEDVINAATRLTSPTKLLWINPFAVLGDVLNHLTKQVMREGMIFLYIYLAVSLVLLVVMKGWLENAQTE